MIGSFEDIVKFATNSCVAVVSLITTTLSFSFNLSYFFGQLIVKLSVALVFLCIDCVSTFCTLIQVLTEDYFVFLSDISSTLSHVFKTLLDAGDCLFHAVLGTCTSLEHGVQFIQNFVIFVVTSFVNFIGCILGSIHHGLVVVKNSLVLVGLTSWDLFAFFPNKVVDFKRALTSFCIECMASLRDTVNRVRSSFHHGLKEVALFVSDIPRESLYGLFLCILVGFIFVKYYRSIQPLLVRNVAYILNQSQKTLFSAWTYLEAFTLWLLTNQMTPSFNGTRHFAAASGADMPTDANNHAETSEHNEEINREGAASDHPDPGQAERKLLQEPEERLCVVCQDNDKCTIILPCRHVCLCYECCNMIKRTHGRCPICRHIVRRTMRVYI